MGINDVSPTGKRLKKGQPVKFKHKHFKPGMQHLWYTIKRKTCPKQDEKFHSKVKNIRRKAASVREQNYQIRQQLKTVLIAMFAGGR
jgi:hypothetical protein